MLDSKEGANNWALNAGFEGRNKQVLCLFPNWIRRILKSGCSSESKEMNLILGFLISQVLRGLERFVVFEKILEVSFL